MRMNAAARALLTSIKESPIVRAGKPASQRHIAQAEKELGVRLPGLYRELLRLAGQIDMWDLHSMFGLGPSAQRWGRYKGITVTELTQMARGELRLPEHLIAISHDGHLDYHCLDTSRTLRGDCPIVLFDIEIAQSPRRRPKRVARGLGEWLRMRVERAARIKAEIEADQPAAKPARRKAKKRTRRTPHS